LELKPTHHSGNLSSMHWSRNFTPQMLLGILNPNLRHTRRQWRVTRETRHLNRAKNTYPKRKRGNRLWPALTLRVRLWPALTLRVNDRAAFGGALTARELFFEWDQVSRAAGVLYSISGGASLWPDSLWC
jgi:hypothetical protein